LRRGVRTSQRDVATINLGVVGLDSNHTVVSPESDARVAPAAPAGAHHV